MSAILYRNKVYGAGGGSSEGGLQKTVLFEQQEYDTFPSVITLTDSYQNYDYLEFETFKYDDNSYYDLLPPIFMSKEELDAVKDGFKTGRTNVFNIYGWQSANQYKRYEVTDTTTFTLKNGNGNWGIKRINGLNFVGASGGGGGGTTIEITPIQTAGIPIATITVDGTEYTLYAPQIREQIVERSCNALGQNESLQQLKETVSAEVVQ